MTPTEAEMARAAGFDNWVDRVAELEAENARLRQGPAFWCAVWEAGWLNAREAAACKIEEKGRVLRIVLDEDNRYVSLVRELAAAIRAMQPPGETEVKHG